MLDTHSHLCDSAFHVDRAMVIAEARKNGITGIVSVSESLADIKMNIRMRKAHPEVLPGGGFSPTNLDVSEAEKVIGYIQNNYQHIVVIGEVGLDFWKVKEEVDREIQMEIFGRFIDLAKDYQLPINVHSRSAGKQTIELLLEKGAQAVQMHAFDGKASTAMVAVEAGFYFSIPPSITRSRQKQKLVKALPLSSLLVETDSPVLGPVPEVRNVPSNLILSVNAIAEIKGISPQEVIEVVCENAGQLYTGWEKIVER